MSKRIHVIDLHPSLYGSSLLALLFCVFISGIFGTTLFILVNNLNDAKTELANANQIINNLTRENEFLILENQQLKSQLELFDKKETSSGENLNESKILGFRNNNPGNLKGKGWLGQIGVDKQGHAIFTDSVYGIRALARVLSKMEDKGIDTIEKLIRTYAGGNPESYIKFMSKFLQLEPDETFSLQEKMHMLVRGIITFECGSNPYPPEYFTILSWTESL